MSELTQEVREVLGYVIQAGHAGNVIHLYPDCQYVDSSDNPTIKETVTLPNFSVCYECKRHYNMTKPEFECDQCSKGAVGLIKINETSKYLCRYHYRKGIEAYVEAMDNHRLLPSGKID